MTMLRAFLSLMLVASTSAVYNIQGHLVCDDTNKRDNDKEMIAAVDAVDDVWVQLYYMERDTLQTYCTPFSVGGHDSADKFKVSESRGLRCINECILHDDATGAAIRSVTFFHSGDSGCYCTKTTDADTNAAMSTCFFKYTNDYLDIMRAKHDSRVSRNGKQMISLNNDDNFIHLEGAAGRTDDALMLMVKVTDAQCRRAAPEDNPWREVTSKQSVSGDVRVSSALTVTMGKTEVGEWSAKIFCRDGVAGFSIRVEGDAADDDSALNGIQLCCMEGYDTGRIEGHWGDWKDMRLCNRGTYVTSFQLRGEGPTGTVDKSAATNVRMKCSDGKELNGGGLEWGTWEPYRSCPDRYYFCGVRAQIQGPQGHGDDTALNKMEFYCCRASPDLNVDVDLGRVVPVGEFIVKGKTWRRAGQTLMGIYTQTYTRMWVKCLFRLFDYNYNNEQTLRCDKRTMARYIRIVPVDQGVHVKFDVKVTEAKPNMAFRKPAIQETSVDEVTTTSHEAGKAVDGLYDSTYAETTTFWRVNLKELITIDKIILYLDSYFYNTARSRDVTALKVLTTQWNLDTWTLCKDITGFTLPRISGYTVYGKEVTCDDSPTMARSLRIENEKGHIFSLHEVEVLEANVVWFNTPYDCFDDTTPQLGCKNLIFDLYSGQVTKDSRYTGRQTHEEVEAEAGSDSLFNTIELVLGERELVRNTLIKTVEIGKEYILKFQVKFTSNDFGRVVRFSVADSHDEIDLGDGGPTVDFNNGDLSIWYHLNGQQIQLTMSSYALGEWITIEVRQLLEGGQYKYSIIINGDTQTSGINNQPTELKDVKVYASGFGAPAAIGYIRRLTLSADKDSLFNTIELVRGERELVKNTLIKTVDVGKEYILKFQVKFTRNTFGGVVRFSVDDSLGDGGPTVFFNDPAPGEFKFWAYLNGRQHVDHVSQYSLNRWITIEVRQLLEGGQYKQSIIIDGGTVRTVINNQPTELRRVKVYASGFQYQAAIGHIRQLTFGKPVYYKLWNKMQNGPLYAGYDYHTGEELSSRGRHAKVKSRNDPDYDNLIKSGGDILLWKLEKVETINDKEYYKIISIDTGGAMHSPDYQIPPSTDHYGKVEVQGNANKRDDQLWEIVKGDDAYYTIVNKKFGQPLFAGDHRITRVADTGANNYQPTGEEIWDLQKL